MHNNINYPSLNAFNVSLGVTREKDTLRKEKKKDHFQTLFSLRESILYTGSLVCKDGLIYEYFPDSIHHESIKLHVYFISSFKSQWPVDGQWRCRLLMKESNCWFCILRMSRNWKWFLLNSIAARAMSTAWKKFSSLKEKPLSHAISTRLISFNQKIWYHNLTEGNKKETATQRGRFSPGSK